MSLTTFKTAPAPLVDPDFPRCLHKTGGQSLIVRTPEALDAALDAGWSMTVPMEAPVSEDADDAPKAKNGKKK